MVLSQTLPTALWVLPVSDVGGVTRHALDAARVGVPGWRLVVALPEGPAATALRSTAAEVVTVPVGPGHGLRRSLVAYRALLRQVRPDLVHTHLAYADLLAALGTRRRTPLVTTEHGIAGDASLYHRSPARALAMSRAHRLRLRRTRALVAVSEATRDAVEDTWHPPRRVVRHVVRNGVDPQPVTTRGDGLHVVSLARLAPEKRLGDLVEAFAVLAARRPDARLTIAGTGPLESELRAQVERRGLADRVGFPGVVDAAELLARADVVAQLSEWENCSYSLLDAMARGVGVVASAVGGNPEMLPERCLLDRSDHRAVADALEAQGRRPDQRPTLPVGWPDVAMSAKLLAEVYAEVVGTAAR